MAASASACFFVQTSKGMNFFPRNLSRIIIVSIGSCFFLCLD